MIKRLFARTARPFEVRITTKPGDATDVFGKTMSKHATLAEAQLWRNRFYKTCLAHEVSSVSLAIVEVSKDYVVRHMGAKAITIYNTQKQSQMDFGSTMSFSLGSIMEQPAVPDFSRSMSFSLASIR